MCSIRIEPRFTSQMHFLERLAISKQVNRLARVMTFALLFTRNLHAFTRHASPFEHSILIMYTRSMLFLIHINQIALVSS